VSDIMTLQQVTVLVAVNEISELVCTRWKTLQEYARSSGQQGHASFGIHDEGSRAWA
jgi:hypothetical protein